MIELCLFPVSCFVFTRRRGPVKYKYQALYELDSLAVVNVKDVGQVKNSFKVLMFPDTRIYQAENPKAKVSRYLVLTHPLHNRPAEVVCVRAQ